MDFHTEGTCETPLQLMVTQVWQESFCSNIESRVVPDIKGVTNARTCS